MYAFSLSCMEVPMGSKPLPFFSSLSDGYNHIDKLAEHGYNAYTTYKTSNNQDEKQKAISYFRDAFRGCVYQDIQEQTIKQLRCSNSAHYLAIFDIERIKAGTYQPKHVQRLLTIIKEIKKITDGSCDKRDIIIRDQADARMIELFDATHNTYAGDFLITQCKQALVSRNYAQFYDLFSHVKQVPSYLKQLEPSLEQLEKDKKNSEEKNIFNAIMIDWYHSRTHAEKKYSTRETEIKKMLIMSQLITRDMPDKKEYYESVEKFCHTELKNYECEKLTDLLLKEKWDILLEKCLTTKHLKEFIRHATDNHNELLRKFICTCIHEEYENNEVPRKFFEIIPHILDACDQDLQHFYGAIRAMVCSKYESVLKFFLHYKRHEDLIAAFIISMRDCYYSRIGEFLSFLDDQETLPADTRNSIKETVESALEFKKERITQVALDNLAQKKFSVIFDYHCAIFQHDTHVIEQFFLFPFINKINKSPEYMRCFKEFLIYVEKQIDVKKETFTRQEMMGAAILASLYSTNIKELENHQKAALYGKIAATININCAHYMMCVYQGNIPELKKYKNLTRAEEMCELIIKLLNDIMHHKTNMHDKHRFSISLQSLSEMGNYHASLILCILELRPQNPNFDLIFTLLERAFKDITHPLMNNEKFLESISTIGAHINKDMIPDKAQRDAYHERFLKLIEKNGYTGKYYFVQSKK